MVGSTPLEGGGCTQCRRQADSRGGWPCLGEREGSGSGWGKPTRAAGGHAWVVVQGTAVVIRGRPRPQASGGGAE